jgi:hypothetical protein
MLTEKKEVFRSQVLVAGATVPFTQNFPVGEIWTRLLLRVNLTVVIGTGAGARSEGELQIIKGITLRTDQGELIVNTVPGRLMYRMSQQKNHTSALRDPIAAATATYSVLLSIDFADPLLRNPLATVLDTRRYNSVVLEVLLGTLTDLYTAPGTATLAPTIDCVVEYLRGRPVGTPKVRIEYGIRPPLDANQGIEVNFERARNISYKRFFALTTGAGLVAGVPFSGDAVNTVVQDWTLDHGVFPIDRMLATILRADNKQWYELETELVGFYSFDFVNDGFLRSSLYSGDKSKLRLTWTNLAGLPNPSQVSTGFEAIRPV